VKPPEAAAPAPPNTASVSQQLVDLVTQAGTSGELSRIVVQDGLTVTAYVREGKMCVLLTRDRWEPNQAEGKSVAHDLGWKEYFLKRVPIPMKVGGLLLQEKAPGLLPGARQLLIEAVMSIRPSWASDDDREVRVKYLRGTSDADLIEEYQIHRKRVISTPEPGLRAEREASLLADEALTKWGLADA